MDQGPGGHRELQATAEGNEDTHITATVRSGGPGVSEVTTAWGITHFEFR